MGPFWSSALADWPSAFVKLGVVHLAWREAAHGVPTRWRGFPDSLYTSMEREL